MLRLRGGRALAFCALVAACGGRGSVTFEITAPTNTSYDPVAPPATVSEYDIRSASGTLIGIASAVQGAGGSSGGRLPLGALMPSDNPVDVYVTALSGGNLLGEARIRDVSIASGKTKSYEADIRKPLIFVGSTLPPEVTAGDALGKVQILDPNASVDLAAGAGQRAIGAMTAGATSWDGRFLFVANGAALGAFDTGSGTSVAGSLTLPFAPSRLGVAPRDQALVALDQGTSGLGIIGDLAGLAANPAQAMVKSVSLGGQVGRAVAFSPDGLKMYVLTGGTTVDPCSPGATAPANAIIVVGTDGTVGSTFTLPGFASDITVDAATGTLVLADATSGQIATLDVADAAPGNVAPAVLLGGLTCPSAVRVVDGVVFAVTSSRDTSQPNANFFLLQRVTLSSGASTALAFAGPTYPIPVDSSASANGDIQSVNIPVRPASIEAYELAMTPDGNRAEFATRAHYVESGTKFELSQLPCTVNLDVVEYGLYAVDVRTGNASYTSRSQLVQSGPTACIDCTDGLGDESKGDCPPAPGDRPAGLAAAFGP